MGWSENARNNEQGVNGFDKSTLLAQDFINGNFTIGSDIKSGGDGNHGSDSMADMGSEFSADNSEGSNESGVETGCCPDPKPNSLGYRQPLPSPALVMMDSPWDILGIFLANSKPENKYAAYALGAAAIILSKGKTTDYVLKGEAKGSLSGKKMH